MRCTLSTTRNTYRDRPEIVYLLTLRCGFPPWKRSLARCKSVPVKSLSELVRGLVDPLMPNNGLCDDPLA